MSEFAATVTTFEGVSFSTSVRAWDKAEAKARLMASGLYSTVEIW